MMNALVDEYWYEHNVHYFKQASWKLKRPLLPKRCWLSQKLMWLKPAMQGVRAIPGSRVHEIYWVESNELMLHKIRYGY